MPSKNFRASPEALDTSARHDGGVSPLHRPHPQRGDGGCQGRHGHRAPVCFARDRRAEMRERVFAKMEDEFNRTERMLLEVTRQKELLETNTVLARSIRLRNPYVDPMHLIQVDLLRRKARGRHVRRNSSRSRRHHQRNLCRPAQHRLIAKLLHNLGARKLSAIVARHQRLGSKLVCATQCREEYAPDTCDQQRANAAVSQPPAQCPTSARSARSQILPVHWTRP